MTLQHNVHTFEHARTLTERAGHAVTWDGPVASRALQEATGTCADCGHTFIWRRFPATAWGSSADFLAERG